MYRVFVILGHFRFNSSCLNFQDWLLFPFIVYMHDNYSLCVRRVSYTIRCLKTSSSLTLSLWYFPVHTPLHVSPDTCTFTYPVATACQMYDPLLFFIHCETMTKIFQKIRVLIWKIHGLLFTTHLLTLNMSWSAAVDAHKSWAYWLEVSTPRRNASRRRT